MCDKIEEFLKRIYVISFNVEYKEFRNYIINFCVDDTFIGINYIWNYRLTDEVNLNEIEKIIDKKIINNFKIGG